MKETLESSSDSQGRLLSERIFEHIEDAILSRAYPPGTHLKEDRVAVELGVSRTPVREAFRTLQRAGWLDLHPHAGAYVRHPSIDQINDVFELRQCLEEWGVELAAARIKLNQKLELKDIVSAGLAAVERQDLDLMARLNSTFHTRLAAATGNELLRVTLENLEKQIRWHFSVVANEIGEDSWREHAQIVEAIERHDPKEARSLMRSHIVRTREVFLRNLLRQGDLQTPRS